MDFRTLAPNFSGGEVSPLLYGRSDLQSYFSGAAVMENFLPFPQGGVTRRPGTKFIVEAKDASVWLVPFFVSREVGYVLEFGNLYVRFIDRSTDDYVRSAGVPVEVVTPYATADLSALRWAQSVDVLFIVHPSYALRSLSRISSTSWVMATEEMEDGPYLDLQEGSVATVSDQVATITITSTAADFSGGSVGKYVEYSYGGRIVLAQITALVSSTVVTAEPFDSLVVDPYAVDDATRITYAAAIPATLFDEHRLRSTVAIWQTEHEYRYVRLETVAGSVGAWYLTTNRYSSAEPVTPVAPGYAWNADVIKVPAGVLTMETITGVLTWSNRVISTTLTSSVSTFATPRDIGRAVRVNIGGRQNWGRITAYVSATEVEVSWENIFPRHRADTILLAKGQTDVWRLGAFYAGNFASQITFHQGRMVLAATAGEPNVTWLSKVDDFTDFGPTNETGQVLDTSGIRVVMNTPEFGVIRWVASHRTSLILGGDTHLWRVHYSGNATALTPSTVNASEETEVRSIGAVITKSGDNVIFIGNGTVNATIYDIDINGFTAKDLSIRAEHMSRALGSITRLSCQALDHDRVWAQGSNGVVGCLLWNPKEEQQGWSRHWLGDECISLTALDDDVYFAVTRPWGTTIEKLSDVALSSYAFGGDASFPTSTDGLAWDAWRYVDCWAEFDGSNLDEVTLDTTHFPAGSTVDVIADGSWRSTETVQALGVVEIAGAPADHVVVGLINPATLVTLPTDAGATGGTGQGGGVAVRNFVVRVQDSYGLEFGTPSNTVLDSLSMRDSADAMDEIRIRSGDFTGVIPGGYDGRGQLLIRKEDPYPLTIVALILHGESHGRLAHGVSYGNAPS